MNVCIDLGSSRFEGSKNSCGISSRFRNWLSRLSTFSAAETMENNGQPPKWRMRLIGIVPSALRCYCTGMTFHRDLSSSPYVLSGFERMDLGDHVHVLEGEVWGPASHLWWQRVSSPWKKAQRMSCFRDKLNKRASEYIIRFFFSFWKIICWAIKVTDQIQFHVSENPSFPL